MTEVSFTHTQFQTPVVLYADMVVGAMFAPTMKSVVVLGPGGLSVPVEGTLEEVTKKITEAKSKATASATKNQGV